MGKSSGQILQNEMFIIGLWRAKLSWEVVCHFNWYFCINMWKISMSNCCRLKNMRLCHDYATDKLSPTRRTTIFIHEKINKSIGKSNFKLHERKTRNTKYILQTNESIWVRILHNLVFERKTSNRLKSVAALLGEQYYNGCTKNRSKSCTLY